MPGRPRVLAHRGASRDLPEHTRSAYLRALADGAYGLECDVRLTADRALVCWHDATVDRTSDGTGKVHDHTLDELRGLDITSWHGPVAGDPTTGDPTAGDPTAGDPTAGHPTADEPRELLTLDDLVTLARDAARPVHLAVELKHPNPFGFETEDAVLEVLQGHGWDAGTGRLGGEVHVSLMSFDPASLEHLAGRGVAARDLMALLDVVEPPGGLIGRGPDLSDASTDERLAAGARRLVDDGVVGGAGPGLALLRTAPDVLRGWLDAGRLVRVWTVDHPADVERCRALGVQELTTNVPGAVLAQLAGGA